MSRELYAYIQQMHQLIQSQNKRISMLEKALKDLTAEIDNLKKKTPIHVDRIEYKFDQLKVETLEGVLNIGLNPSDLNEIENFEVDNQSKAKSLSPKEKMETTMELENSLHRYLDSNLKILVKKHEKHLGIEINETLIDFIKEDIKKQLPVRINEYLKKYQAKERTPEAIRSMMDQVEKQIKEDIENAVLAFINNLPKQQRKD